MKLSPDMAQLIYKLQPKFKMMTTSEKNQQKYQKIKKDRIRSHWQEWQDYKIDTYPEI